MCHDIMVVVEECKRQLIEKNFTELKEKDSWEIKPGGLVRQNIIHTHTVNFVKRPTTIHICETLAVHIRLHLL